MKKQLINYSEISPNREKPWVVALKLECSYDLFGYSFLGFKKVGFAASSGFNDLPDYSLTVGAVVIDASSLGQKIATEFSNGTPTLEPDLPPLTIKVFSEATRQMEPVVFSSMEKAIEDTRTFNPVNHCSVDIYVAIWEALGADIGTWDGNNIVFPSEEEILKTLN